MCESIFCISHNIGHKIRLGQKLVAVTYWKHKELAPEWNFAPVFKAEVKLPWNEILLRVHRVTTYKSFLIDRGDFTLGWNLMCDTPLNFIYKSVLQITERWFLTYFVYYMNMDITYSQEWNTKCASARIYNLERFPQLWWKNSSKEFLNQEDLEK